MGSSSKVSERPAAPKTSQPPQIGVQKPPGVMARPPEPPPQLFGTNPPGPPPPLLPGGAPMPMPGMSFNPGQFFNMFEGVNMPMGPPPGQQLQQQLKGQGQQQQAKGQQQ